jgi:hypothetical protein
MLKKPAFVKVAGPQQSLITIGAGLANVMDGAARAGVNGRRTAASAADALQRTREEPIRTPLDEGLPAGSECCTDPPEGQPAGEPPMPREPDCSSRAIESMLAVLVRQGGDIECES